MKTKLTNILFKVVILAFCALPFNISAQANIDSTLSKLLDFSAPLVKVKDLKENQEVLFLDAREIEEFNVSHIPNAAFVGYETFSNKKVQKVAQDKEQAIIVYCSVGYRSEIIANRLIKMGYTNVHNLYGGIFEWKNADYELVNTQEAPTDSVHVYSKEWGVYLLNGIKVY